MMFNTEKANACVLDDSGSGRGGQTKKCQVHCVHKKGLHSVLSDMETGSPTFWEVTCHCNSLLDSLVLLKQGLNT